LSRRMGPAGRRRGRAFYNADGGIVSPAFEGGPVTSAFAQLPCPASPLRRLDPRWKLAALVFALVAVTLVQTLPSVGAALVVALGLAAAGRLPLPWLLLRLGGAA